jgi:hypothetical protein
MATSEKLRIVAAACALLAGVTAAAPGRIIYVDDDATGANDGSSWANAFPWLRVALAAAVEGDEIRVAQGTYKPYQDGGVHTGRRVYVTFSIGNATVLHGGYAGGGALDPNARNVEAYRTILSGDLNDDDPNVQDSHALRNAPERAENSLCVVTIKQVDWCVLDGFLIQGGRGSEEGGGGGLSAVDSSPTVWNCTFSHNLGRMGGAVSIVRGNSGTLRHAEFHNCKFQMNAAWQYGGALYVQRAELLLTGCEFVANTSSWGGGVSSDTADVSLSCCLFRANRAGDGGALYHNEGDLHLMDCTFLENAGLPAEALFYLNTASGRGGAVLVNNSSQWKKATATDCLFRNNEAVYGGALEGSLAAASGCRFTGNVAHDTGGAVDNREFLVCANCLFDGNRATSHIGALRNYDRLVLTNCTFAGNRSPDGEVFQAVGGHGAPVDIALRNCIVWGRPHGLDAEQPWLSNAVVTYSDIEGGYPGTGNIDADPLFADPGRWDLSDTPDDLSDDVWIESDCHLKSRAGRWDPVVGVWVQDEASSPCIDAGGPGEAVSEEPLPNGGRVNMGAYGGTAEASKSYLNRP